MKPRMKFRRLGYLTYKLTLGGYWVCIGPNQFFKNAVGTGYTMELAYNAWLTDDGLDIPF